MRGPVLALAAALPALVALLGGCAAGGAGVGASTPPAGIERAVSPESEYYLGRAVAASILSRYRVLEDRELLLYLNLVGNLLARASERPDTFGGYHFQILDSDEVNAFAAPGGLIFVTRGMLRCCAREDALAGVLAHEIAHIERRHALQTMRQNRLARGFRKSRMTSAVATLGVPMAGRVGASGLVQLAANLETSIGDVTDILVRSGYLRRFEQEADAAAVELMQRVGYDPRAMLDVLAVMGRTLAADPRGFAATHPPAAQRAESVTPLIVAAAAPPRDGARETRFARATAHL